MRGILVASLLLALTASGAEEKVRRLSVKEYRDKMESGWIGQILGVSWGAPTEGQYRAIMPEEKMPPFTEDLINHAFGQDDLYVEMTFLRSMEEYGFDVSIRQAGIDFANSGYALWVANDAGRRNLRNGIAPPDSSHPKFHNCAGAIDYQIEADYAGLIAPGMPQIVIAIGEKFGRLMNYGDGVYAGQFMGALYAEAFFEKDVHKLIEAGLACIPAPCMYAEMVRDLVKWHGENPDWTKTWKLVVDKYRENRAYNISALDVKLEGAFVLMGLLYGNGDLDKTIIISCRCGSDSDCNPSSSGGILFTTVGRSKLPDRYAKKLDRASIFSHTAYSFPGLIDVCEKLARQAVARAGGRIEKDPAGEEVFVLPVKAPVPSAFEDLKAPGPIAGSRFTDEEMRRIKSPGLAWALPKFLPGWSLASGGGGSSFLWEHEGKRTVLSFAPPGREGKPWVLAAKLAVPAGKPALRFAAYLGRGGAAWTFALKANGTDVPLKLGQASGGWPTLSADLAPYAGKEVALELSGTLRQAGTERREAVPCCIAELAVGP